MKSLIVLFTIFMRCDTTETYRFFSQQGRVIDPKYRNLNSMYHTIHHNAVKNETESGKWHIPTRDQLSNEEFRELDMQRREDRQRWEQDFLKRSDDYLDNQNRVLSKYQQLKRAKQRMNNNLYKTRAVVEKYKKNSNNREPEYNSTGRRITRGWNTLNRNSAFDRMHHMTKKQLRKIRDSPKDFLENPDEYMHDSETMENTPYIGRF